jgi:glutamine amidotransferase
MSDITIIDYGLNNLKSVRKAFEQINRQVDVVTDGRSISDASALVLPGICAFGDGMVELKERNFVDAVSCHVRDGRPLFGICLGMQMLFSASHELGYHEGLDLIPGEVVPLAHPNEVASAGYKVPQVGWNEIRPPADCNETLWGGTILEGVDPGVDVYFVHSLFPEPEDEDDIIAVGDYGNQKFVAAVESSNVVGTQFHPEKSGQVGIRIIQTFCEKFGL